MRVYYFTSEKYGLENINKKRIKISDFSNLNDPFELLGIKMSNTDVRKAVRFEKSKISKNMGIVCFSETKYDPVQWAHYADNHKGVCLGFDIPDGILKKVKYVSVRLAKSYLDKPDITDKLLTTKFKHWSYEKEHRLVVDIKRKEKIGGFLFENFSDSLALREVYIGCQSELKFEDIISKRSSKKMNVVIKHTRPAFKDFRIVWDQNKKSIRA